MSVPPLAATLPPSHPLEQRFEAMEKALLRSLVDATPEAAKRRLGLGLEEAGSATCIRCDAEPHLFFNRIIGVGGPGVGESEVEALLARSRRDNCLVQIPESRVDPERVRALAALGVMPFRRDWVVLARSPLPLSEPVSTPLEIRRAQSGDGAAFAAVMVEGFDMPAAFAPALAELVRWPGWHVFVACDGARVVAGGALFLHHGVGYFALAATSPSHRGQGAQRAFILQRIRLAYALGCDLLLTETGVEMPNEPSPSLTNLRRAGFEPIFLRRNFAWPGSSWTGTKTT